MNSKRIKIGLDLGASAVKLAAVSETEFVAGKTISSDCGHDAFCEFVTSFPGENGINVRNIEALYMTGVGSFSAGTEFLGLVPRKIGEFEAIGRGAAVLTGFNDAVAVSMGTGSAFVRIFNGEFHHIGGSGVGGGTLLGLSSILAGTRDVTQIAEMAQNGMPGNVDLLMSDLMKDNLGILPPNATASNFGALKTNASKEDFAAAVISLVMQSVGMMAVFACAGSGVKDVVLTGSLTLLPQCGDTMRRIQDMCGINFHIPPNAEYAAAIGATLV